MDAFRLPRSTFAKLPTATLKGVMVALLELADDNGRVLISIRELAKSIGMEYQPLRTALKYLYANAIANATSNAKLTQRLTQITICNIEDYDLSPRKHQRNLNATANAATNAITGPRKSQRFTPPSDSEVREYVTLMGYHFNPDSFNPHYQSNGWKVGGQPMKDWKAACRTWEIRWKQQYGELFYYQLNNEPQPATPSADFSSRAQSRRRMSSLASEIVSRDAGTIIGLYDGQEQQPHLGHD